MIRQKRDFFLVIAAFVAAWFAFVGLVLAALPGHTQQVIGWVAVGLLPVLFGTGFYIGRREASNYKSGIDKGLGMRHAKPEGYSPKRKQEPAVDFSQVLNGPPQTTVTEVGGNEGVREL